MVIKVESQSGDSQLARVRDRTSFENVFERYKNLPDRIGGRAAAAQKILQLAGSHGPRSCCRGCRPGIPWPQRSWHLAGIY